MLDMSTQEVAYLHLNYQVFDPCRPSNLDRQLKHTRAFTRLFRIKLVHGNPQTIPVININTFVRICGIRVGIGGFFCWLGGEDE